MPKTCLGDMNICRLSAVFCFLYKLFFNVIKAADRKFEEIECVLQRTTPSAPDNCEVGGCTEIWRRLITAEREVAFPNIPCAPVPV
jgi:hypothetical protein